jgi:hypothetical protein
LQRQSNFIHTNFTYITFLHVRFCLSLLSNWYLNILHELMLQ